MEVGQIATQVADLLREGGWVKGSLVKREPDRFAADIHEDDTGRCLFGAFNKVVHGSEKWPSFSNTMELEFISALGFGGANEAIVWNNASDRTKDEVLERLEAVAA